MRRRIYLGLAPLFVLLLAMGVSAVALFANLGSRIDVILRENFRSVVAGQQMKEAAERMDSALAYSLAGEEARGRQLYADNVSAFRQALHDEFDNITLPGERELAESTRSRHEQYTARATVFWETQDAEARRKMYFDELLPLFTQVKDSGQEIIRINQDNMVQADRDARQLSARSTRVMIAAVALGFAGAIYFARQLQRSILLPISALTSGSKELGEGKLDQVVPVASDDELGQLADTFNKMATKLRAYHQMMGDQVLQARQMTEITFSAFPDPIIALSTDGRIDFSNPAAVKFLNGLGQDSTLPPNLQAEVNRVLQGGPDFLPTSFDRVVVFRVADEEVYMLPRVIGMRDEAGRLFGTAVILQNVTRLRLLDEVKTNLVSTVSHELKTPLTSVRMGLHLLLEERIGPLNEKQSEILLAAREDAERLLRMLNDLLDLAKLEQGDATASQTIGPKELIESAAEQLRVVAESRGSRLVTEAPADLPAIAVDPEKIAHVFSNLVSNAAKHTPAGGEILLRADAKANAVRFSVIDQGNGITPEHQAHVFERFYRIPGAQPAGAGLGLAIAREIVTAQGGTIGVHSTPGEGSEFYFDLPVRNGSRKS